MIQWEYDGSQYTKNDFEMVPEGKYQVKIKETRETLTRNGKNMVAMRLNVVDMPQYGTLYYNLILDPAYPGMVNQKLGRIYDSFDITPGNMEPYSWIGCVGTAKVKHKEDDKGKKRPEISFLPREDNALLPPKATQKESSSKKDDGWDFKESETIVSDMIEIEEDTDIPF
jgi:hypothetical protein